MRRLDKHKTEDGGPAEDFAPHAAEEDVASVGEAEDMWVGELELPDYVAGVGCEGAESGDEEKAAEGAS